MNIATNVKLSFLFCLLLITSLSKAQNKAFDEFIIDKTFDQFSSFTEKSLPATSTTSTVTINSSQEIHKVRTSLFGTNSAAWQGNFNASDHREENWRNAHYSFIRYPGGNWSNGFFWDGNVPATIQNEGVHNGNTSSLYNGSTSWYLETDEYPDLLADNNAEGIVCVNVGYAFYGSSVDPVATAAQYAADWVDYYNNQLGLDIKYWELGNENYGRWQAGYDLADAYQYGNACVAFANAMKAVDPDIEIGVVLFEGYGGLYSEENGKDWNERVLPIVEDIADFLIVHHYPHPKNDQNNITEADIYEAVSVAEETYEMIHDQVSTYTSKPENYFPVAITEYNARSGVRILSRTNVLFTTMMLGEYAKYDFGCATQWDMQNGYNVGDGDHGATANNDPYLNKGDANPELYVHHFMHRYFGDALVQSTSNSSDIVTYATTFSSGELGLVLINKGTNDQVVELDLQDFTKGQRLYWHTVNGDESDFDRTVYINDQGPGTTFNMGQTYTAPNGNQETATAFEANGVSGPQNFADILPYSATIPTSSATKFDAPRYSVSYIVFEGVDGDCAVPELGENQSICGLSEISLGTGLTSGGKSFTWSDQNGSLTETGNTLTVSNAGTYTVQVDSNGCIASDFIIITDDIPEVDFGPDQNLCQATSLTLDAGTASDGLNFGWTKDGALLSEDNNTLYITAAGTYALTISAPGCQSQTDEIIITSDLPEVVGDTICNPGDNAQLEILSGGNYSWYDAATDGLLLETGTSYTVEVNTSTTYYVQDENSSTLLFGKTEQDGDVWGNTAAGVYENTNRQLNLTVDQDLTLVSFDIFVNTNPTDLVVNISGTGGYSDSWSFNDLPSGRQTITVNASLLTGSYTLDFVGTVGGIFIQHNMATDMELPGYMSFTNAGGTTFYGMCYSWMLSVGSSCARTPVVVVLDPQNSECIVTDLQKDLSALQLRLFPNPTNGLVQLSEKVNFQVIDGLGQVLHEGQGNEIDMTALNPGAYLLKTDKGTYQLFKN